MKDQRLQQVEQWARYCKNHMAICQQQLNPFIDSQLQLANDFYKRLAKTKDGIRKIRQIKRLKAKELE